MNARNDKVLFLITLRSLLFCGGEGKPKSILPPYVLIYAPISFLFTVLLPDINISPVSLPECRETRFNEFLDYHPDSKKGSNIYRRFHRVKILL